MIALERDRRRVAPLALVTLAAALAALAAHRDATVVRRVPPVIAARPAPPPPHVREVEAPERRRNAPCTCIAPLPPPTTLRATLVSIDRFPRCESGMTESTATIHLRAGHDVTARLTVACKAKLRPMPIGHLYRWTLQPRRGAPPDVVDFDELR